MAQHTATHNRHRLRQLGLFFTITILLAGAVLYQQTNTYQQIKQQIDELRDKSKALASDITFGTFEDQDVDTFIENVSRQIDSLQTSVAADQLLLENTRFFSKVEAEEAAANIEQNQQLLQKYQQEREFMALAWIDYNVLRQDPKSLDQYIDLVKNSNQFVFSLQKALVNDTPVHVESGQIIGMQGCSGVCTGTHLHFVTSIDEQVVDPCTLLPDAQLTIWGTQSVCGTTKPQINWPVFLPWIITQNFGVISPVIYTRHEAIDIIDREFAPVLAAHDGWLYSERRDCAGAVICNSGAANIVTICEQKGCRTGIKTEYWHLAWMVE